MLAPIEGARNGGEMKSNQQSSGVMPPDAAVRRYGMPAALPLGADGATGGNGARGS
jgi:hypothetical protein